MIRQAIRNADGEIVAATCVDQPLSPEAEAAMVALVEAVRRDFAERDADGSLGDRQQQACERLRRLGIEREPTP